MSKPKPTARIGDLEAFIGGGAGRPEVAAAMPAPAVAPDEDPPQRMNYTARKSDFDRLERLVIRAARAGRVVPANAVVSAALKMLEHLPEEQFLDALPDLSRSGRRRRR